MVTASPPQQNISNNGAVTEKTVYWTETIVRWTRGTAADVRIEPTEGAILLNVHRGDMVHVRTDLKRGEWVPCRAGHVTGWLNTQEVKLIRTGVPPMQEVIYIQTPPPVKQAETVTEAKRRRTNLIQRLIKFFK